MSQTFKFNFKAVDGEFSRSYNSLDDFIKDWISNRASLSTYMVTNDGINVITPADDFTKDAIVKDNLLSSAKDARYEVDNSRIVNLADSIGLGWENFYLLNKHISHSSLSSDCFLETEHGRFFVEHLDGDNLYVNPFKGYDCNIHSISEDELIKPFKDAGFGLGIMKPEGINFYLIDLQTMLIEDTTKTHKSIDDIKSIKSLNEKAAIITRQFNFHTGNEDTPGTNRVFMPTLMSVNDEKRHQIESYNNNYDMSNDFDNAYFVDMTLGYRYSERNPVPVSELSSQLAYVFSNDKKHVNHIASINSEYLKKMRSVSNEELHVQFEDGKTMTLDKGTHYNLGESYTRDEIAPIKKSDFKLMTDKEIEKDFTPF